MKKIVILVLALGFSMLVSMGFAQGEGSAMGLFEAKCSKCHQAERATSTKKDAAGWTSTVNRMKGKSPGHISDVEAETIIKYLTESYSR